MVPNRIAAVCRDDYAEKSGGDVALLRYYLSLAGAENVVYRRSQVSSAVTSDSHFLVANVDRHHEFVHTVKEVTAAGGRPLLAPIHHPSSGVRLYNRKAELGLQRLVNATLRTPYNVESVRQLIRDRQALLTSTGFGEKSIKEAVASILAHGVVVLQAASEGFALESEFGVCLRDRSVWVPNPIRFSTQASRTTYRDIDVIVAGRIEPRKNQLRIAQHLANSKLKALFVGGVNERYRSYARRFFSTVESGSNLQHLGHASLVDLDDLYLRSRVCVGLSFMEVVSLAQLDAVGHGAHLLTTEHSYTSDYLLDTAAMSPLASKEEFLSRVHGLLRLDNDHAEAEHLQTKFPLARSRDLLATAVRMSSEVS
jgi:glycosyltransferase involved in cell wall biosynthesis